MTNFKWIIFRSASAHKIETETEQKAYKYENKKQKKEQVHCQRKLMSTLIKPGNSSKWLWALASSEAFRKFTRPSENAKTRVCQLWQNG